VTSTFREARRRPQGSLTVVGTGIDIGGHFTPQARASFEHAGEAFYLVADPVAAAWLEEINPRARSLHQFYVTGEPRVEAYEAMVDAILEPVRAGRDVCAAFYGHPGVFVYAGHKAVKRARGEGFGAWMLPGISSLDCLFADLGIDPGRTGCQVHHATEFLLRRARPDASATLILLQISVIGVRRSVERPDWSRLPVLVEYLSGFYPGDHEVIAYEASPYPVAAPVVERMPLSNLAQADLATGMTLVVPPAIEPTVDATMRDRLGLPER
jgi:uncharacterized protein YabN with tetrapyrrole methylase and pyrophosphatase domain